MNEELKKYYDYLKSAKADVPDTYESFATTLSDEAQAKTYFDYLKANKFDAPDTYESFSETLGLQKKKDFAIGGVSATASQGVSKPQEESLTPPQPLESVDIPNKIDSLILNKESTQHPLLQPAETTSVDTVTRPLPQEEKPQTLREYMAERHVTPKLMGLPKGMNFDRVMDEGEKENYDDLLAFKGFYQKPQKPSYFWGTVKSVNLGTASFFQSLDNASKTLSNMTGLKSGGAFGDIAEYLRWHESYLPNTPDTRAGRLLSNVGGLNGMFLELAVTPSFKLKMLGKVRAVPKIVTQLMGTGFVNRYAEGIEGTEPTGKEMAEGLKGAGVGLKDGAILVGLGYTSGVLGELVKTATKSGVAGVTTGVATNAVGFGGADAVQQLITTGNIDWRQTEQSFDIGLALGLPALAQYAGTRAWNNFITASPQAMSAAKEFKISPEDARKKAIEIRAKSKEETDIEKRASMESVADVMDALTDIKLVRNSVAKDPTLYKKVINSDTELTIPEKEFYNKQIDAIAIEDISTPPIKLAQNELRALNEDLANIETKLTPTDPIIDAQTKLIKEQIKQKQEVLSNLISGKIPDEIRFAGESFASKEDAFKWLDNNYNRKERLASASEVNLANDFGMKVFNEWYKENKAELTEKGYGKNLKELKNEIKEEAKDAQRIGTEDKKVIEQGTPELVGQETDVSGVRNDEQAREVAPEEVTPVQETKPFTELEQEPKVEQPEITSKEAISAPIVKKEGGVPTVPTEPVKTAEKGQGEATEKYTLGVRALNSPRLDQDIKDAIQKEGINYVPRGRKVRAEEAQEIVSIFSKEEGGLDKIEAMVYNTKNDIPNDTRTFLNVYLADQYNSLKNGAKELPERDRLRQKVVDLYMFGMEQGKLGGQHVEAQKEWSKVFGNSPEMVSALVQNHIERKNRGFFQSHEEEVKAGKQLLDDVFNSPEGKARIEQEISEEISKIGTKNFGAESKKKIDDFFNGLLIDPKHQNMYGGLLGISAVAWNGSVLAVKHAVLLGMDIASAIQKGAEYIDKWYKDEYGKGAIGSPDWNRKEYEAHMKDKFSGLKKEVPITEKPSKKRPPKVKTPPTQEEMVNKLLEKMAGFATKKQLQGFMKDYMQEFLAKGLIGDQRFKDLLAKALGMDYVSDGTEAKLTASAQTLGYAQKKIKEVADAFDKLETVEPNTKEFDELRKKLNELKKEADKASFNGQKANQYIKSLLTDEPELLDKVGTLIQGNLLVPTSIIRNIYGNVFMAPAKATRYLAMNTADIILSQAGIIRNIAKQKIDPVKHPDLYRWAMKLPSTERTVDMFASFRGFRSGAWAGLKEGVRQLKTGQLEDDYNKKEIQRGLEPVKALLRLRDSLTGKERRNFSKTVGDILESLPAGYMGEGMFRLLNLGDKPFRRAAETARLSEIAEIKGLKGLQREKFLNNPDNASLKEAQKVGDLAVYTNDNAVSKLIEFANRMFKKGEQSNSEAIKSTSIIAKTLFKLGKATILPYVRTPVNLAVEAFEYAVPAYSFARSMEATSRGNRREALDYFGKAVVGTMISSLAVSLIKNGIMTTASSTEDKMKQAEFAGKEGYRLNIDAFRRWTKGGDPTWQDGDNTVTLKGYGTMSMIMMAYGAAYKDKTTEEIETESAPERWATVFGSVVSSSLEQSIMTGVNTALQAALKGEKERDRWLINTATALSTAVYPSTIASISKTFADENYLRETRDVSTEEGQFRKQMVNTFKDRLFMGKDLPTKVSIWGEPVKMIPDGNTWTYNLLGVSKNKKYQKYSFGTKMFELYEEYKKVNPDEAKGLFPSLPSASTKVGWDDSRMTPDELMNYQIRVGELRAEYAENYVNSEEFKDASIEEKTQKLTSMYSKARQIADSEMFRWSGYEEREPAKWKTLVESDAVPIPSAIKRVKQGNKEYKLDNDDMELLNNIALGRYAERVVPFLESNKDNMDNLKKVDEKTGKSRFVERVNDLWRSSLDYAKRGMIRIKREEGTQK